MEDGDSSAGSTATSSDLVSFRSAPERQLPETPDLIEFTVGDKEFWVNRSTIAGHSPYIDLAVDDIGSGIVLENDDPEAFNGWMICLEHGASGISVYRGIGKEDVFAGLPEVWILAEKLHDWRSANEVVDEIQQRHNVSGKLPRAGSISAVMAGTTAHSPLRRLIIDLFVLEASQRDYAALAAQGVAGEFWYEVAGEMRGLVVEVQDGPALWGDALGKRVRERPRCDYHLFVEGDGCASCGREKRRARQKLVDTRLSDEESISTSEAESWLTTDVESSGSE